MRAIILGCSVILAASVFTSTVRAVDEVCAACDRTIIVSGEVSHRRGQDSLTIEGAPRRGEEAFREEVYGTNFTVAIPNLEPGRYTVVVGLAEVVHLSPGQRTFNINCGEVVIARNLDIYRVAGGPGRVVYLTNQIDHPGDAQRGPLTLTFTGRNSPAKLNTLDLRSANGVSLVSFRAADLIAADDPAIVQPPAAAGPEIWKDPTKPIAARVQDLVRRLSLAEKARQMRNGAPAVSRLGLPAYNYWNECLHGVGRAGIATVFPQAIGMAATWNTALIQQTADVIATEARAKHHEYARTHNGDSSQYHGLTFWTPNINIFRDPRWGRGQETYGEDPFLTSRIGVAFIHGLQGNDPKYLKTMACAKHFAVHSGPELERHRFNVNPSDRDLYETYLPQFEAAVREGQVGSVMGAYNRVRGEPACSSPFLLSDLLRKQWGFNGHVVSDCGAIYDIYANHRTVALSEYAAARAVLAGCDLCCGTDYNSLTRAAKKGLITEKDIDVAVGRLFEARFRLGLFDPPEAVPFAQIPISENNTPEHEALALRVARESMVLLKNNGLLPLDRSKIKRIAVIGTNAFSVPVLLGNYSGTPSAPVTIFDGIKAAAGPDIEVFYQAGCPLAVRTDGSDKPTMATLTNAMNAAWQADVVVYVGGISPQLEGEEMRVNLEGFNGGDRTRIELPAGQTSLLKGLSVVNKPLVFVNCSGSAIAMPWEAENLPAILQVWYPGEQGGRAVGEVLFGDVNPAGRLPITFYRATTDLPAFDNYSMSNRTYRYFNGKPLFAFGRGLSYTRFAYMNAALDNPAIAPDGKVTLSFDLANIGTRDGDDVPQVYFRHMDSKVPQAKLALCGFTRVPVGQGKTEKITIEIPAERFRYWDVSQKKYVVAQGNYELMLGAASDDIRVRLPLKIGQ
jgi:beta-glucosidase